MRKSNTKARIVEAAWQLFYEHGYDGTTVEDVVRVSGTSKGSFYHYFESKDALLGSLAYLFDAKYAELEGKIREDRNALEVLLWLNRELFDMIENPDMIKQKEISLIPFFVPGETVKTLHE